jgi:hypothetical protein
VIRLKTIRERFAADECVFSLDLKSASAVSAASFGNGNGERLTMEGTIGTLKHARFVEDVVLELVGTQGVLRVDLASKDLAKPPQKSREGGED